MTDRCDVLVVGAGPAGSTTAGLLAERGHRVVLVDRAHFPRSKVCAEYLSPGVVTAIRGIGAGRCLEDASPLQVPGMEIVSPQGQVFRLTYQRGSEALNACTLSRRTLDSALLEHAASRGADIRQGFVARTPVLEGGTVTGVLGTCDGSDVKVSATVTVIADGSRSSLARRLGLAVAPRWPVRMGLVAHYDGAAPLHAGFGQMHVALDGYCGVAPLPGGLLNVAIVLPVDTVRRSSCSATEYFERWIAGHPRLRELLSRCRRITPVRGVGPIGSRSRQAWAPGALLVGDAASFFDPFTGEGIYRAIQGARLAAQVAHTALIAANVSSHILQSYGSLRRSAFARKEAVTSLVQLFVHYPSLMEYALPRLNARALPGGTLGLVLGDVLEPREFLRPRMLWSALRP